MVLPPFCRYVPWPDIGLSDNIMIDGSAKDYTVLTLSHWPKSGTPHDLKADSSAEIVFNYIEQPGLHENVTVVTGDHFDEDACLGIFAMLEPEFALEHKHLICDAAIAGDFTKGNNQQANRIAFTIGAFCNPVFSPLDKAIFKEPYDAMCGMLFKEILPRVRPIIEHTHAFEELWKGEDDFLNRTEQALSNGAIIIEEHPGISFAVVTSKLDLRNKDDLARGHDKPWHPIAIHNRTRCDRILSISDSGIIFAYRYESWVQYITLPPPPRIDLHPLAETLTDLESGDTVWKSDSVENIFPRMVTLDNQPSSLHIDKIIAHFMEALATGKPAWDPFDKQILLG
ncbi:MAG: hypothetical protein HON65_14450 [Rhodospirillales bacterium]|jgi:hypothetical protein|nr:hypothetical protein [Rhodospirillales bacterium]